MKKIKWEVIDVIVMIIFSIASLVKHIIINGIYLELGLEVIIYYLFTIALYYAIKATRKGL